MYFYDNDWKIAQKLEKTFPKIINDRAQKMLEDSGKIKKYERKLKFKLKKFDRIFEYFSTLEAFFADIEAVNYRALPKKILRELGTILSKLSRFQATIRTIRAKYKQKDAFEDVE